MNENKMPCNQLQTESTIHVDTFLSDLTGACTEHLITVKC